MTRIRRAQVTAKLVMAAALAMAAGFQPASAKSLRILLASDIYKMSEEDGRGGHARLAGAVKAERAKGGTFLFVHAGDAISPCLMCGFDQGQHLMALMNMTPPDIFVPGNHEYDFGKAVFLKRMKEAAFPILAANLAATDGSLAGLIQSSRIIDVDGVKVGILGATADDAVKKSNPEDLRISATVETVTREAAALRTAGADFVVAIVHASRDTDKQLIEARAADLLLSGDDHDLLWSFDGKTGFVEGGEDALYLTAIDIDISVETTPEGRRITWVPTFRMIDTKTVTPDPAVARAVQKYEAELSAELDVAVADVPVAFDSLSATVRLKENLLGNMVADALRSGYQADIALINGGGLRGGKQYQAGAPFTRRDVLTEMPFGNKAVVIELKGLQLRTIIEYGLALLPAASGRFPHVSGANVHFDPAAPAGQRITRFEINGADVRNEKLYTLVTNDFLLRGGDGYPVLASAHQRVRPEDGRLVANEVLVYLKANGFKAVSTSERMVPKK